MKKEIWKPIKGYEGLYEVSNLGRVKSLRRNSILKAVLHNGYLIVSLRNNGITQQCRVHRLVAEAFILNPYNLPCVNHKDEIKTNNKVDNLEWCSVKYNTNYGTGIQRRAEKQLNDPKRSIRIKCFDLVTKDTSYYASIKEAARQTGFKSSSIGRAMKQNGPYLKRYIFSEQ